MIDPVREVAAAAAERDILCHLDLCIGGWALPFILEDEGREPVDMSIPDHVGVDGPAQARVRAQRGFDPAVGQSEPAFYHYCGCGLARLPPINNTLLSSRSVAPAAAAWAVLHLGQGRVCGTGAQVTGRRPADCRRWEQIPGYASWLPRSVAGYNAGDTGAPEGPDVRIVSDEAHRLGWSLQVQPRPAGRTDQHPPDRRRWCRRPGRRIAGGAAGGHCGGHRQKGRADPDPQLAAIAASIDVDALDPATIDGLMQVAGFRVRAGRWSFRRDGRVNAFEASPAPLVEVLLKAVFAEVFTPNR